MLFHFDIELAEPEHDWIDGSRVFSVWGADADEGAPEADPLSLTRKPAGQDMGAHSQMIEEALVPDV